MQKEMLQNLQNFSSQALDSLKQITEANQKVAADLLKQQSELTNTLLQTATKSTEALANINDPKDLTAATAELVKLQKQTAKDMANFSQNCSATVNNASKTYNEVLEGSIKAATAAAEKSATACANQATGKSTKAA